MAIEHNAIADGERHEPKGIASASVNDVYIADGAGSGAWSGVPTAVSSEIVIKSASDFPSPVSNVITLSENTRYIIDGSIDVGDDRFVLASNTQIVGNGTAYSSIVSTTTGNLFTASTSFTFNNFAVTCTSGTVFACTGGAFESAYLKEFTISSASSSGMFTAWYSLFWDKGAVVSTTSPLSFSGACTLLILDLVEWITGYTTAVDLGTATFNTVAFHRCGFGYSSATNHINIAASSANLNAGFVGRLYQCTFNASATNIVNGRAVGDLQWRAEDNTNLENTAKFAQLYATPSADTSIGSSGVYVVSNWNSTGTDGLLAGFSTTTGGRLTYIGMSPTAFHVGVSIAGESAGATSTFAFRVAVNGTTQASSTVSREFAGGGGSAVGAPALCQAIVELTENDYVELWITNTSSTVNFTLEQVNIVVTEVN